MSTQLLEETWEFTLLQNDSGSLELIVTCGSVGLFEVHVFLNEMERSRWESEGESFIRPLVKQIQLNPEKYLPPKKETKREKKQ